MKSVSEETRKALEGARTEAGANMTLVPTNDYSRGWNAGIQKAIDFIEAYERGEGLFQQ